MEAKDNKDNKKNRTLRAARILLSALAFIALCVGLALLFSPGMIWSGYVGIVDAVLVAFLVLSMFCMAVTEPTLRICKSKKIKISIWLIAYIATIICLFVTNGWWEPENIGIIYRWVLEPMGLYSEGHLAGKIFGLIILTTAVALLMLKIKRIIYKAIDNIEIQSDDGENSDDVVSGEAGQRNSLPGGDGSTQENTTILGRKAGRTDKKSESAWKKWVVVAIVVSTIVILMAVLFIHPKVANLISKQEDGTIKDILSILSLLISTVASILGVSAALIPIAVALLAFGFVYKTGAIIFRSIIKWTKGEKIPEFSEWFSGFISWTISIAIVFGITKSTSIDEIINAFASKLSGIEPVKTFVAIILALFVAWLLQEIIRIFIAVAYEIGGKPFPYKREKTKHIIDELGKIFGKLIEIALDIISGTLSLAKIIPNFVKYIGILIDSSENNPDEIEDVIVASQSIVLDYDPESESIHEDINLFCTDLYNECIENCMMEDEPTDNPDEEETAEDNSNEEENR